MAMTSSRDELILGGSTMPTTLFRLSYEEQFGVTVAAPVPRAIVEAVMRIR